MNLACVRACVRPISGSPPRRAPAPALLQEEMAAEIRRVTSFVIDRELEAPQRFQAIQSYRAAMAVLAQQERFVAQLFGAGVLDAGERETMLGPGGKSKDIA